MAEDLIHLFWINIFYILFRNEKATQVYNVGIVQNQAFGLAWQTTILPRSLAIAEHQVFIFFIQLNFSYLISNF